MISVVIPAHNESERITTTINSAMAIPNVTEVVVIDDGSSDDTSQQAAVAGARVVRLPQNRGKAAAVVAGIEEARAEVILLLDADLGETSREAEVLTSPILNGTADLTIATFPIIPGKGGGMGIVVRVSRWGIHRLTGLEMQAPLSGQRAFRRELWGRLPKPAVGFGLETAFTIDAARAGARILEVPTTMTHRVTGKSWHEKRHRMRQLVHVVWALAGRWFRR